jgi:FOG: Glucan-binding domain (YG repeat)
MNTKKIVAVMALMIAVLLSQNVWATKALVTEAEVAPIATMQPSPTPIATMPPTPPVTPIDLEPEVKDDWQEIGGRYYYLAPGDNSQMLTGWQHLNGSWYYLMPGDDGRM